MREIEMGKGLGLFKSLLGNIFKLRDFLSYRNELPSALLFFPLALFL